jgi:hypothetical protein
MRSQVETLLPPPPDARFISLGNARYASLDDVSSGRLCMEYVANASWEQLADYYSGLLEARGWQVYRSPQVTVQHVYTTQSTAQPGSGRTKDGSPILRAPDWDGGAEVSQFLKDRVYYLCSRSFTGALASMR